MSKENQNQKQIDETTEQLIKRIQYLTDRKLTGSVTVNYHFLNGRLMAVDVSTKETLQAEVKVMSLTK